MSTSTNLSVNQKGSAALIIIIVLIILGVAAGAYLITKGTSFFPNASYVKKYSPPSAIPESTLTEEVNEDASYDNPFGEEYENPFESL